jgi:hypothetical protein
MATRRPAERYTIAVSDSPIRLLCAWSVVGALVLGACSSQSAAPNATATGTQGAGPAASALTPRAYVPAIGGQNDKSGNTPAGTTAPAKTIAPAPTNMPRVKAAPQVDAGIRSKVLFIQGDHVPESGYPHSRVRDDGKKPESFTRLRSEVLEGDLMLAVDEFVLARNNKVDATLLGQYGMVVLGSNARVFNANEVAALTSFYNNGGSILVYADFQYGPNNWDSDNSFLNPFGVEVLTDNFQPTVDITDLVATHPIMAGVKAIRGEGISQFIVSAASLNQNQVLAKCSPQTRSGCILPPADLAKVKKGDVVACVFVRENAKGGRLAGVCDRNLFHNGPGPGSDLDQVDDRLFARNLFRWLSKQ